MDYSERVNSKQGSGGVADSSLSNVQRRQRVALLLSAKTVEQDPYIFTNHLGLLECKLCLTTHVGEGSIGSHIKGRKHQANLQRRALKSGIDPSTGLPQTVPHTRALNPHALSQNATPEKKSFVKIGKPSYKVTKIRHPQTFQLGLLLQINLPSIKKDTHPFHRFMSAYEQSSARSATAQAQINGNTQNLVISAEPYESIAFQIPAKEIEKQDGEMFWTHWDEDTKEYVIQFFYKD